MDREAFLKLYAGIVAGLGIPGGFDGAAHAAPPGGARGIALDDTYLVKGLTGMVRAKGWFNAHWGASVLAGYYLCRDNPLGEETTRGIQRQLDALIASQPAQFAPLPDEPADRARIEEIPRALLPAMQDGLREHGHAVIFASLSVKALRDVPQMARPTVVAGLCGLSREIARKPAQKPPQGAPPYADTQAMVDALFDRLARFQGLLGQPGVRRPNFTHMVTHTDALMNLELMGYPDLARAGYPGHQAHVDVPVPEVAPAADASAARVSLATVMSDAYWTDRRNTERWNQAWGQQNPNGYWVAFGHLFKVLYSYHRLIGHVADKEKVKICSTVLLQRYMNPEVQGG